MENLEAVAAFRLLSDNIQYPVNELSIGDGGEPPRNRKVIVLRVENLIINLLGRHAATERGGSCQLATTTRFNSAHRNLGIEHQPHDLWNNQSIVLLRAKIK